MSNAIQFIVSQIHSLKRHILSEYGLLSRFENSYYCEILIETSDRSSTFVINRQGEYLMVTIWGPTPESCFCVEWEPGQKPAIRRIYGDVPVERCEWDSLSIVAKKLYPEILSGRLVQDVFEAEPLEPHEVPKSKQKAERAVVLEILRLKLSSDEEPADVTE